MRRIAALLRKEVWEHGALFLGLAALLGSVFGILLLSSFAAARTMTMLEVHATFVRFFLTLTALALGRRLVVREYHGRTQLFIEALPIRRGEMLAAKLGSGLFVVVSVGLASLALCAALASVREPITLRWIALIAGRTAVFAITIYSFFFMMGLLGRWRFAAYAALIVGAYILDTSTALDFDRFPPIALVGETFVLERFEFPLSDALISLALAAGFAAAGLALALVREGSVAEALSRSISQREKVAVAMLVIAGLTIGEVADDEEEKEPFAFTQAEVVRAERAPLDILYVDERNRRTAEELAAIVEGDLVHLRRTLRMRALPPMHIALEETLDADRLEWGSLEGEDDGALLRANFAAPGFAREELRSWLIEGALQHATENRAAFEPNSWVRTAVARMIAHRDEPWPARAPVLRALWLARHRAPSFALFDRWDRSIERFDAEPLEAAAYVVGSWLERRNARGWRRFVHESVGVAPPWGMRAVIEARREPTAERLERLTGASRSEIDAAWRAQIEAWRRDPRWSEIHRVPRAQPHVAIERGEGDLRTIVWGVRFTPAPEPGSTCALAHTSIGAFDQRVSIAELTREERPCEELGTERLVGRYAPGDRVLLAIEIRSPILGAPVCIYSERREIR